MAPSRNIYKNDVDFSVLALQDAEFNKHLKPNGQLDFSNPETVKQLTKSLLKRDFGLAVELPDDRLCPPVPNRLSYVLWVQDILDETGESPDDGYDPDRTVVGLDIGTGASCIYPLLSCAQRPKWRLAATGTGVAAYGTGQWSSMQTEIDERNLQYARQNILANELASRIRLVKTARDGPLIALDAVGLERVDFTICNPPFYTSEADLVASAKAKSRPPHSACTGAEVEMVTPGGEVAFVSRMVDESKALKGRVQWYTSMLGKISSILAIAEKLKEEGVSNWAVTEFVQGGPTRRWAVAWSWVGRRPKMETARGIASLPKHLLPFPSEYSFSITGIGVEVVAARVDRTLQELSLQWQYRPQLLTGIGFAKQNVWSRSARRRGGKDKDDAMDEDSDEGEPALGFKLRIRQRTPDDENGGVEIRWLRGLDSVLFESFCGMLKRQISLGG